MAHYGKFKGVSNYIAIVGSRQDQEKPDIMGKNWFWNARAWD